MVSFYAEMEHLSFISRLYFVLLVVVIFVHLRITHMVYVSHVIRNNNFKFSWMWLWTFVCPIKLIYLNFWFYLIFLNSHYIVWCTSWERCSLGLYKFILNSLVNLKNCIYPIKNSLKWRITDRRRWMEQHIIIKPQQSCNA